MTALDRDRYTPALLLLSVVAALQYPADGGSEFFGGGIGCLDSNGNAVPGTEATGLTPVGRIEEYVDNTSGENGEKLVRMLPGIYRWDNSEGGDEIGEEHKGLVCYIADDHTVALTDNGGARSKAGVIVNVDDDGVWVAIGFAFLSNPAATPAGTLQKRTVTVPYNHAAFLAESDDGEAVDINVGTALPVGAIVVAARYTINEVFAGEGVATLTMIVGKSGDTNGVIEAVDIFGDATGQYQGTLGTMMVNGPSLQSEVQLVANFDPDSSAGLDELTAGEVTIDVYYFVAF